MSNKRISSGSSRVLLTDIARNLGVSLATVSRVLNGHPDVAPHTRQRVLEQLKWSGYKSSSLVGDPEAEKNNLIAIITPEVAGGYFSELIAGIVEELGVHYSRPEIGITHHEDASAAMLLERSKGVTRGVLLIQPGLVNEHLPPLLSQGFPCVVIDPKTPVGHDVPVVAADNLGGARAAAEYLIAQGHRRIGVITGGLEGEASRQRLQGFKDALRDAYLPYDAALVRHGAYEFEDGYRLAKQLLLETSDPPTALFAFNDIMASGAIRAAFEARILLPKQLAIMGFDDSETARYATPGLTSVRQPLRDMGRTAVRVLYDLILGRTLGATHITLSTQLVPRASTEPVLAR